MMNPGTEISERLSAFVDDELGVDEIEALLDSLDNPACRAQLHRFGSCRPQGGRSAAPLDLSARVAAQIRSERGPSRPGRRAWRPLLAWQRLRDWRPSMADLVPVGSLAAAASVALVAFNLGPEATVPAAAPAADPAAVLAAVPAGAAESSLSAPAQTVALAAAGPATAAPNPAVAAEEGSEDLVIPAPMPRAALDQMYLQHARFRGGYAMSPPATYARAGVTLVPAAEAASDAAR